MLEPILISQWSIIREKVVALNHCLAITAGPQHRYAFLITSEYKQMAAWQYQILYVGGPAKKTANALWYKTLKPVGPRIQSMKTYYKNTKMVRSVEGSHKTAQPEMGSKEPCFSIRSLELLLLHNFLWLTCIKKAFRSESTSYLLSQKSSANFARSGLMLQCWGRQA